VDRLWQVPQGRLDGLLRIMVLEAAQEMPQREAARGQKSKHHGTFGSSPVSRR